nr:hypothetical protein [Myxococcota bacterium]
ILAFVLYDVLTAFTPALDQRLNTYPFSGFPMFARLRATPPYDEHHPYVLAGDSYAVTAAKPLEPYAQAWFDHTHRHLHRVRDPARIRAKLTFVLAAAQQRFPWFGIMAVRHHVALFVAPAYPAPARFERHPIAITGELLADGRFRSVLGAWSPPERTVELRPLEVDTTGARLGYYPADAPVLHELAATRAGETFTLAAPLPANAGYLVAILGDERWLVASTRAAR